MSLGRFIRGKTEHSGPKRGRGAWCRKRDAKMAARRKRRAADRREAKR